MPERITISTSWDYGLEQLERWWLRTKEWLLDLGKFVWIREVHEGSELSPLKLLSSEGLIKKELVERINKLFCKAGLFCVNFAEADFLFLRDRSHASQSSAVPFVNGLRRARPMFNAKFSSWHVNFAEAEGLFMWFSVFTLYLGVIIRLKLILKGAIAKSNCSCCRFYGMRCYTRCRRVLWQNVL